MTTINFLFKLALFVISSGVLYQDISQSIQLHRNIFTLVAMLAFIGLSYSIVDTYLHVTKHDGEDPLLEIIFPPNEESIAWEKVTKNEKQLEDCQSFITDFPDGTFLNDAKECVAQRMIDNDSRYFQNAKSVNSIAAYRQYINQSNNFSRHIQEAEKLISSIEKKEQEEEFDWHEVRKTLEGCQTFLDKYQSGKFSQEAMNCISQRKAEHDNEAFGRAEEVNTISAYQEYINNCGKNICGNKTKAEQNIYRILEQEETANWNSIASSLTLEQCRNHLDKYPHGKYSEQIKECINQRNAENDNEAFQNAERINTITAYQGYINSCVKNTCQNKSKAHQNIIQLVEQEETTNWNLISDIPHPIIQKWHITGHNADRAG